MLKFMMISENSQPLEEQLSLFQKETQIEVELIAVEAADFASKVASMIKDGNLPDVITLSRPQIVQLQANGFLKALDNLIEGSVREDFLPDALANNIFDGQLFALPWRRGQACSPYYSSLALFENSNQPDEALKLINFLTQPELQVQNYKVTNGLYFPTRQSVYKGLGFECPPSGKVIGLSLEDQQRAIAIVEERAPALQSILKQNSAALQQIGVLQTMQSLNPLLSTAAVRYEREPQHEEGGCGKEFLMLPEMDLKILAREQQITVRDAATDELLFDLTPLLTHLSSSHQRLQQERQARLQAEAKLQQRKGLITQAMLQMTEAMLEENVDSTLAFQVMELKATLQASAKLEGEQAPKQSLQKAAVRSKEDEEKSTMLVVAAPVSINFSSEEFEKALLSESGVIVGAFFGVDEPLELELSDGNRFTIQPGQDVAIKWRADEGQTDNVGYYLISTDGNEERIGTTILQKIQGDVEQPFVTIEIGSCTICYHIDKRKACPKIIHAILSSAYVSWLKATGATIISNTCD